ncbi:MAG: DegV family EDD domain-containing protein [Frankiales bacterium]|nr:DegV family EDD domain-containing protein [Frankiales bacterium]
MHRVAIVTDSTAYLPADLVASHGIRVVPVQVVVGGHPYDEGVEITPAEVAAALREWTIVTTSRPSPDRFAEAYAEAAAAGATAVVSAHLSGDMSGTYDSAVLAARDAPVPVEVVDTRQVAMAMGFAVLDGARAAEAGADPDAVATAIRDRAAASSALFYVDTLDYLRRGGRIGAAQALLGQALAVKPILELVDGRVAPLEKVRTTSRALARIEELVLERAAGRPCDVAVHHLDAAARAETLAGHLVARMADSRVIVAEVGAVVGAHVGPGMVAVGVSPRPGGAAGDPGDEGADLGGQDAGDPRAGTPDPA